MMTGCIQFLMIGGLALSFAATCVAQQDPFTSPLPKSRSPGQLTPHTGDDMVSVEAVCDVSRITPGEKFNLAFIFDIKPHWHIYWRNPGISGGPTEIQVTAPPGFEVGQVIFPRPLAMESDEGATYGYEERVVLFVPITAPPELSSSQAIFNAKINWMVCKDICLLGHAAKIVTVSSGSREMPQQSPLAAPLNPAVKEFKSHLPQPLSKLDGAHADFAGGMLTIKIPAASFSTAQFFPVEMPGVTYGKAEIKKVDQQLNITVPVTVDPNNALGQEMKIIGVVGLGQSQTDPCYEFEIPLSAK